MKRWLVKNNLIKAFGVLIIFSILIVGISAYFIHDQEIIGLFYILIGFVGIGILRFFGINLKSTYPDIIFGVIDNGILILSAILGGLYGGITGAVLGGAAGNAITDGIGGIFEGRIAEKLKRDTFEEKRNSMSTMLGKLIGCLFGAGLGLTVIWIIGIIWTLF